LLRGAAGYKELGERIVAEVKVAHSFRRADRVRDLSNILIRIPIKEYQLIARYYLVWCEFKAGRYDVEALESIIEQSRTYKFQALLSRAAVEAYRGKPERALYFYTESLRASATVSERLGASMAIAVEKAKEGFHASALKDIEALLPLIRHAEPRLYFDLLNSYAVELGQAGRLCEARNICQVVLASPFAYAYPEWRETAEELRPASRSFTSVGHKNAGRARLLHLPQVERRSPPRLAPRPAQVVSLPEWKQKAALKDSTTIIDERYYFTDIIKRISAGDVTPDHFRRIHKAVVEILSGPEQQP
jgi:hypothetical protein